MDPSRVTVLVPTYNRAHWLRRRDREHPRPDLARTSTSSCPTTRRPTTPARSWPATTTRASPTSAATSNCGLNEHYNTWFERVETEFLFIVPDDDRLAPDAVALTVAALDANPSAGLVHGQVDVVDEHGAVIAAAHDMTGLPGDTLETGAEFIRRSMAGSYRVHASTVNLRTEAVRTCLLDERDYPVTDLGHWLRVALDWDLLFLARPLARYRIHEGAYSAGAAAVTAGGYIQGAERIEKFLEVKLRFLAEHGERLDGVRGLRAAARRAFRRELLEHAAHATFPERRLVPTVRALRACIRLDAATLIEPAAWRIAAGGLIGPRAVSALKRLRRAPRTSLEVTA